MGIIEFVILIMIISAVVLVIGGFIRNTELGSNLFHELSWLPYKAWYSFTYLVGRGRPNEYKEYRDNWKANNDIPTIKSSTTSSQLAPQNSESNNTSTPDNNNNHNNNKSYFSPHFKIIDRIIEKYRLCFNTSNRAMCIITGPRSLHSAQP